MSVETSVVRVWFLCKSCKLSFRSTTKYCQHKIQEHFSDYQKVGCIVFEETIYETPVTAVSETETEPNNNIVQNNIRAPAPAPAPEPVLPNSLEDQNSSKVQKPMLKPPPPPPPSTEINHDGGDVGHGKLTQTDKIENPRNLLTLVYYENEGPNNCQIKSEWVEDAFADCSSSYDPVLPTSFESISTSTAAEGKDYNHFEYYENFAHTEFQPDDANFNSGTGTRPGPGPGPRHGKVDLNVNPLENRWGLVGRKTETASRITATATRAKSVQEMTSSTSTVLKCSLCSKEFTSEPQLGIHFTICQLYNTNKSTKNANQPTARTGTGTGSQASNSSTKGNDEGHVKCSTCFKLVRICNFELHQKLHGRSFVCPTCDMSFGNNNGFKSHLRSHSHEPPYKCPFPNCPATFKYGNNLSNHKKVHANNKRQ